MNEQRPELDALERVELVARGVADSLVIVMAAVAADGATLVLGPGELAFPSRVGFFGLLRNDEKHAEACSDSLATVLAELAELWRHE